MEVEKIRSREEIMAFYASCTVLEIIILHSKR
jgi:hypothetical protein